LHCHNLSEVNLMTPELSIIVPILNEQEQLRCLLTDLLRQQEINFEVILSDGGSQDNPGAVVAEFAEFCPFPISLHVGIRGRGRQLNAGIAQARADWLLLLHVDSRFFEVSALRCALDRMQELKAGPVAGRFPLHFRRRQNQEPHCGYYYYEWKTRLPRKECIHGDQGFLLSRETFQQVGSFRENLPVMEDTDFAERLRLIGHWELLPGQISTSARRFETEGLWQRQTLNALIMCIRSIGWEDFFGDAMAVYRQQGSGGPLRLRPFFRQIKRSMKKLSVAERRNIWFRSGSYILNHAWQLAFALDARRAFRQGIPVGQGRIFWLNFLEPLFKLLTQHPPGRLAATLLLWFGFYAIWFGLLCVERPEKS
jgi:rSAM/selenodomain-associated transferase 2